MNTQEYTTAVNTPLSTLRRCGVRLALLMAGITLGSGPLAAGPRAVQLIVLKAGRMIDGSGAGPISPAMILVEGDRITNARVTLLAGFTSVRDMGPWPYVDVELRPANAVIYRDDSVQTPLRRAAALSRFLAN